MPGPLQAHVEPLLWLRGSAWQSSLKVVLVALMGAAQLQGEGNPDLVRSAVGEGTQRRGTGSA